MNTQNKTVQISRSKLVKSTFATIICAALLLILIVLPAEYGIDLTGFGKLSNLTDLNAGSTETIEITDIIGGNEVIREVEIPMFGEPTPLPNPQVFQDEATEARTTTMEIELQPLEQTEIKTVLEEGKVIIYSWEVLGDEIVYIDFHGHDASFGPDFFVRYKEQQEGRGNNGSLTAPFSGEHGWFWLNISEVPITISLSVTGYYEDIIDYGIF
tara:strand:+ start:237237 stop:237875 length:639 start_codon:yes stop_codon:yes gene_type:complete